MRLKHHIKRTVLFFGSALIDDDNNLSLSNVLVVASHLFAFAHPSPETISMAGASLVNYGHKRHVNTKAKINRDNLDAAASQSKVQADNKLQDQINQTNATVTKVSEKLEGLNNSVAANYRPRPGVGPLNLPS